MAIDVNYPVFPEWIGCHILNNSVSFTKCGAFVMTDKSYDNEEGEGDWMILNKYSKQSCILFSEWELAPFEPVCYLQLKFRRALHSSMGTQIEVRFYCCRNFSRGFSPMGRHLLVNESKHRFSLRAPGWIRMGKVGSPPVLCWTCPRSCWKDFHMKVF